MKDPEQDVDKLTEHLRKEHADEIARDPHGFKKRILRRLRRGLPPRRGRPTRPEIEAALAMRRQGKSVGEILRAQVTGFNQLDTCGRMLAEKALRQGLARRRKAHAQARSKV